MVSHANFRLSNLTYLSLPNPEILEDEFFIALPKFESLTGLAVDQYFGKSVNLLSLLHNHRPNLTEFKLFDQDDCLEHHHAMIICHYLPNLRKLEIPIRLSRRAILTFFEELQGLEYLDISGYQDSVINKEILEKASRLKVFIWHSGHELGEFVVCSNCGGSESVETPCQCALEEKIMEWLANPWSAGTCQNAWREGLEMFIWFAFMRNEAMIIQISTFHFVSVSGSRDVDVERYD